jgi:hypothetical protein
MLKPTIGEVSFDESNKENVGRNCLQTLCGTTPLWGNGVDITVTATRHVGGSLWL